MATDKGLEDVPEGTFILSLSLWDGDCNAAGGRRWAATALALRCLLRPPPDVRTPDPCTKKKKD
jgi:hypothetical protein